MKRRRRPWHRVLEELKLFQKLAKRCHFFTWQEYSLAKYEADDLAEQVKYLTWKLSQYQEDENLPCIDENALYRQ